MDQSPGNRDIEKVSGEADVIMERGTQIETLGQLMASSASELEDIATGTTTLRGKAVDKLKEGIGEAYVELRNVAQMYEPTGPVVHAYGVALDDLKPKINTHVDTCETLWSTYDSLPGDREGRGTGGLFGPDEGSPEAAEQKAEDDAKQEAYEAWETEAGLFDDDYEDWEAAFDLAAERVGTILDGSLKDSKWDMLDGFVADMLTVLKWVGIAVAVLGMIIGGPFLAALGAILALATLALTVYQVLRDDAGLTELAFAIVGVIPFGSIGKGGGAFLDDMLGGFPKGGLSGFARNAGDFAGSFSAFGRGFSRGLGQGGGLLNSLNRGIAGMQGNAGRFADGGFVNALTRLATGQNGSDLATLDWGGGIDIVKHSVGNADMATNGQATGGLPSPSLDEAAIGSNPEPITPPDLPWED
ncbi:hypothetical protein [Agrococcus versicolor]